jgi:hypothetical protein
MTAALVGEAVGADGALGRLPEEPSGEPVVQERQDGEQDKAGKRQ